MRRPLSHRRATRDGGRLRSRPSRQHARPCAIATQQPSFLPTPTNLFRSQVTADGKAATDEGVLREGSLCSIKACAFMVINTKCDNLRRLILQYESALAEITRLQDLSSMEFG